MLDFDINWDSFRMKARPQQVFRIDINGSATLLWLAQEPMPRYLEAHFTEKLRRENEPS